MYDNATIPQSTDAAVKMGVDVANLVAAIRNGKRRLSKSDHDIISGFYGWGAAAKGFDREQMGRIGELGDQLRSALGDDLQQTGSSTETSFFTNKLYSRALWIIARELGFTGGRVLDIGIGTGNIEAHAPLDMPLLITGVEAEPLSAALCEVRLPDITVINKPIETVDDNEIRPGSMDFVVGNVPFSQVGVFDKRQPNSPDFFSLHNYCIWRGLTSLRPGGLLGVITSRFTLDNEKDAERRELAKLGRLVGAIRLPENAHKDAQTRTVTDIVFFQRFTPEEEREAERLLDTAPPVWLKSDKGTYDVNVNRYFQDNPLQVLGSMSVGRGQFGPTITVAPPSDITRDIDVPVDGLVSNAQERGIKWTPVDATVVSEESAVPLHDAAGREEGSFHLIDGKLVQIRGGVAEEISNRSLGFRHQRELAALVRIRDAIQELTDAEMNLDTPDYVLMPLRATLNRTYDDYRKRYGYLSRSLAADAADEMDEIDTDDLDDEAIERLKAIKKGPRNRTNQYPALRKFRSHPDYVSVLALEDWDEDRQVGVKADIFRKRVNVPVRPKTRADSPAEAFALCFDQLGCFDIDHVAQLLREKREKVPALLGDLVYEDPETLEWLPATEYLADDVRIKLKKAREVAEDSPQRFGRNVQALEAVQPAELGPEEIEPILGADFIEPEDIEDFIASILPERPQIEYEPTLGTWDVMDVSNTARESPESIYVYGTDRRDAYDLLSRTLNNMPVDVYDTIPPDDKRVRNVDESVAADEKAQQLQQLFKEWVFQDPVRTTRICNRYNDLHNAFAAPDFDPDCLTYPGMAAGRTPRDYQKSAAIKGVVNGGTMFCHPVGAGKTATMAMTINSRHRFGLTKKAVVVVPKSLLAQTAAEFRRWYPASHVLMCTRDDLETPERRKLLAARIAYGKWTTIVMTQEHFKRIALSYTTQEMFLLDMVAQYAELARQRAALTGKSLSFKRLQTMERAFKNKLQKLRNFREDDVITFEKLGIDEVYADEIHTMKALPFPISMQGVPNRTSQRAFDLFAKLNWLSKHTGKSRPLFGLTGTELTNSPFEIYTWARFHNPTQLVRLGMGSPNQFANLHVKFSTRYQISVDGRTHKAQRIHVSKPTPELVAYFDELVERAAALDTGRKHRPVKPAEVENSDDGDGDGVEVPDRDGADRTDDSDEVQQPEDIMLKICNDGSLASIHLSLVGREGASLKLIQAADTIIAGWRAGKADTTYAVEECPNLQLVFCDYGVPEKDNDRVYGIIRDLLIERGMPSELIRFAHEATNESETIRLDNDARNGKIAVLLGTTGKMGLGRNFQNRLMAVHTLSGVWTPDIPQQQFGRAHRSGNTFSDCIHHLYVTEGTLDSFRWQTVERKALTFQGFRNGDPAIRSYKDEDATTVTFTQLKAAATGDQILTEQAELQQRAMRLRTARSSHIRATRSAANDIKYTKARISNLTRRAQCLDELAEMVGEKRIEPTQRPGAKAPERKELIKLFVDAVHDARSSRTMRSALGKWGGVRVTMQSARLYASYTQTLLLGDPDAPLLTIPLKSDWLVQGQQYRMLDALTHALTNAKWTASEERVVVENLRSEIPALIRASDATFEKANELADVEERLAMIDQIIDGEARLTHWERFGIDPGTRVGPDKVRKLTRAPRSTEPTPPPPPEPLDAKQRERLKQIEKANMKAKVASLRKAVQQRADADPVSIAARHNTVIEKAPKESMDDVLERAFVQIPFDLEAYSKAVQARRDRQVAKLLEESGKNANLFDLPATSPEKRREIAAAKRRQSPRSTANAPADMPAELVEPIATPKPERASQDTKAPTATRSNHDRDAARREQPMFAFEMPEPDYKLWRAKGAIPQRVRKLLDAMDVDNERYVAVAVGSSGQIAEASFPGEEDTIRSVEAPRLEADNPGRTVLLLSRHHELRVVRNARTNQILTVMADDESLTQPSLDRGIDTPEVEPQLFVEVLDGIDPKRGRSRPDIGRS